MLLLDLRAIPPTPWKNGGGSTRELAVHPEDAGLDDFDWRISVAEVGTDGPFSPYPGVDRSIMLLDGAGMLLDFPDGHSHALVKRWEPFHFHAELPPQARLLGGPTTDFNLMLRRGTTLARMDVLRDASVVEPGDASLFLFVLAGAWRIRLGDELVPLSQGQALLKRGRHGPLAMTLAEGGSVLLFLQLRDEKTETEAAHDSD